MTDRIGSVCDKNKINEVIDRIDLVYVETEIE